MSKTKQGNIQLGSIPVNVYQVADGNYELEAESVTSAIDKHQNDLWGFLNSRSIQVEIEIFVAPIPLSLAMSYWLFEAFNGNEKAQALGQACMAEAVERRLT